MIYRVSLKAPKLVPVLPSHLLPSINIATTLPRAMRKMSPGLVEFHTLLTSPHKLRDGAVVRSVAFHMPLFELRFMRGNMSEVSLEEL